MHRDVDLHDGLSAMVAFRAFHRAVRWFRCHAGAGCVLRRSCEQRGCRRHQTFRRFPVALALRWPIHHCESERERSLSFRTMRMVSRARHCSSRWSCYAWDAARGEVVASASAVFWGMPLTLQAAHFGSAMRSALESLQQRGGLHQGRSRRFFQDKLQASRAPSTAAWGRIALERGMTTCLLLLQ